MAADKASGKDAGAPKGKGGADGADEDEVARRFREALERKQAHNRAAHGEDHRAARGVGPASNDKHTRQFRRKSG